MTREECKNIAEAISFKIGERQRLSLPGVNELIDQIFNDHEAQLKAKESDLERQDMIIKCLNIDLENKEKLLKAKDEEIKELGEIVQQYLIPSKNYDAIIKAKDDEIERLKAESKQSYIEGSKSCDDLLSFYITKIASLEKKLKVSNDSAIK